MMKMKIIDGTISTKPPAKRYGSGELLSDASTCAGRVWFWTVRMLDGEHLVPRQHEGEDAGGGDARGWPAAARRA